MLRQHTLRLRRCMSTKITEEEWTKQFAVFCNQIQHLSDDFKKKLTTAFVLPDIEVSLRENGPRMNIKQFFLEHRRLYMRRKLLPHRQWQLERFGVPLEWPRRPAWRGNNILTTDFGTGREGDNLEKTTPIFDPFEDPSWTDKQMKQSRSDFMTNPEFSEWYNQMPSILRQVRLAAKPTQQTDSEDNLIHHEREGLYSSEKGIPVPMQEDLTYDDYHGLQKQTVFKPAMPRRKRAMILLKALQYEKIMPEHLMHQELDLIVYQLLKLNRFDPDIPNKRGVLTEKATYRARRARAEKHQTLNERTKATRVRGYLEWFWRNTEEGKNIMRERRRKATHNPAYEKEVQESLSKLRAEQSKLGRELDEASNNVETFTGLIEQLPQCVYTKIGETNASGQNLLDRRWKWLMYKEDKLNDFKRVEEILEHFEFRLSNYEEPLDMEVQKFAYSDLVYDSPWPSEEERRSFQREHESREYWDTDETYKVKQNEWRGNILEGFKQETMQNEV